MHSGSLSSDPHMMSLNIDMKIIRPLNCDGSPILVMNSWTLLMSCNVVNPGKIFHSNSIGSPSTMSKVLYCGESLKQLFFSSQAVFHVGFWFTVPRQKPEHAIDWWLHHWPKIVDSTKNLPTWSETLQKSHVIVRLSTFQICQTSVSKWDRFLFFFEMKIFVSNSFPWIQMLPMSKT